MDVVLRTPNGDAEITLGPGQEHVALGELVERVTGRPPGHVVFVDGRAVPAVTPIETSGLLNGSTISTTDDAEASTDELVELVQVAGPGAGARRWLASGRFRIGVGRRVSAGELELAPVENPMIEVVVDASGRATVRAIGADARLDGVALQRDRPTPWTAGLVDVAGRVFDLGRPDSAASSSGHRFGGAGHDGTVAFNRPPRIAAAPAFAPLEVPAVNPPRAGRGGGREPSSKAERAAVSAFTGAATARHRDETERRRAVHPDLARAVQLAETSAPELWQRRSESHDGFQVAIGLADLDWSPELARGPHALASAPDIISALGPTPLVPVTVDLRTERGVGVVGGGEFSRSLVRGLLIEAAVTHGPADLEVVVLTSDDRAYAWEWVKWLPHARVGGAVRILSTDDQVSGWAAAVQRGWEPPPVPSAPSHLTVVVVDESGWWRERAAPLRPLFVDTSLPLRFVAVTGSSADVPAVCTTVVAERSGGDVSVDHLTERRRVDGLRPYLASPDMALVVARRLASLDDPDVPIVSQSALPTSAPLLALLGLEDPTVDDVVGRWRLRPGHRAATTIGIGEQGPVQFDLDGDGPHALIGGTRGSGKSELLRSLVSGLATDLPPSEVNFLLVDVTGDATFDACARLPHTVGVVTDLDEHLARRLLRCLRAELRHREGVLRDAGTASIVGDRQHAAAPPLPRLVMVVDDLASVAAELPELLPSLVDVAERGQSTGFHLVVATDRPARVADDTIRATTNLRIALRVQDAGDSVDVIGTDDAVRLPPYVPGRALARVGGGELTPFQTASSSGAGGERSSSGASSTSSIDVVPYVLVRDPTPMESKLARSNARQGDESAALSDLDRLADAIVGAAAIIGTPERRQLYPDPLPDRVPLAPFFADHPGDAVPFALVDLPDEQRQAPGWWSPGPDGSLIAYGITGAGTTSLLVTLLLGLVQRCSADDVHVYCIDADTGALAPFAAAAHVGGVVRLDQPDRIGRLVAHLTALLHHRTQLAAERGGPQAVAASEPAVVVVIDDVGALRRHLDERADLATVWADLERVIVDGRPVGICAVMTATHERAVPPSVVASIPARLVMRLGDRVSYAAFGLQSAELPAFVPGRAVRTDDAVELQLVEPPASLADAIAALDVEPARERPAPRIDPLPSFVTVDAVLDAAERRPRALVAPVGLDARSGDPAVAVIPFGESMFVTGAPGTGRSSILFAVARATQRAAPDVAVFVLAPHGGPLTRVSGVDQPASPLEPRDVAAWIDRIAATQGPRVVLVDDADRLGDLGLERLASLGDASLIVAVAGHGDDLRVAGHWSTPMRRFRHGVFLRPAPSDGDLIGVSLGAWISRIDAEQGMLVVDGAATPLLPARIDSDPGADETKAADR